MCAGKRKNFAYMICPHAPDDEARMLCQRMPHGIFIGGSGLLGPRGRATVYGTFVPQPALIMWQPPQVRAPDSP